MALPDCCQPLECLDPIFSVQTRALHQGDIDKFAPRGRDQFLIVIKSNGKNTTLAFPEDPCSISERLRSDLSKFFRVEVEVKE